MSQLVFLVRNTYFLGVVEKISQFNTVVLQLADSALYFRLLIVKIKHYYLNLLRMVKKFVIRRPKIGKIN